MAKRKTRTLAKEIDLAAELLQKLVRLKAADDLGYVECATCSTVRKWNDGMQGGHFISRTFLIHKLREENVHPQCKQCNGPKRGNVIKYTTYMIDCYGRDFVDWLESTHREGEKYYKPEIIEMQEEFKRQIKEQEHRLGI